MKACLQQQLNCFLYKSNLIISVYCATISSPFNGINDWENHKSKLLVLPYYHTGVDEMAESGGKHGTVYDNEWMLLMVKDKQIGLTTAEEREFIIDHAADQEDQELSTQ